MPGSRPLTLSFPPFAGMTKNLIFINLGVYTAWLLGAFPASAHADPQIPCPYPTGRGPRIRLAAHYLRLRAGHGPAQHPLHDALAVVHGLLPGGRQGQPVAAGDLYRLHACRRHPGDGALLHRHPRHGAGRHHTRDGRRALRPADLLRRALRRPARSSCSRCPSASRPSISPSSSC